MNPRRNPDAIASPNPMWLAIARLGLGILFLVRTTGLAAWPPLHIVSSAPFLLGWPDATGIRFGAALALPDPLVMFACLARTAAAALFVMGIWTRPAGLVAGVSAYVVASQDPVAFNMTKHVLFLGMIVLALTDAGARLALRARPVGSVTSGFGLVRIWVASIYVWAGLAKMQGDWLSGRVLEVFVGHNVVHGWLATHLLATPVSRALAAPVIATGEIAIGLLLLWRKSRRPALVAAYAVHVIFQVAMAPDLLGWAMAALLCVFIGDLGPWRRVFAAVDGNGRIAR